MNICMQEDLSTKQPWDHCHTLQTSKPTTSDSSCENYERQLYKVLEDTTPKHGPKAHHSRPVGPLRRPPGLAQSSFTLRRLVLLPTIYTVDSKVVWGQFIQWWSREVMQIDDVAIPCPLLYLPYIYQPLPPPSVDPESLIYVFLMRIRASHQEKISTL
jgi:hypothetical protein